MTRNVRRRLTTLCAVVAAGAAIAGAAPAQGAPAGAGSAGAAATFCGLGGFPAAHRYVWTGAAHDGSWQTAGNWNVGGVPAASPPGNPYDPNGPGNFDDPARAVDYVCIGQEPGGAAADVTLGGASFAGAAIATLDLGQGADLTVTKNSRLWLNGPQTVSRISNVRAGSTLELAGATLGGAGTLNVAGVLDAASTAQFPVTITTRWCDVPATCSAAPTTRGRINVAAGGLFAVDGAPADASAAGINLEDERLVDNSGTIRIAGKGYIAADYGTTIRNEAGASIVIANDFGIYEGRNHFGPVPLLSNKGTLRKSAGTGTSVISVRYQQVSPGTTRVESGTLTGGESSVGAGVTVPAATVAQGGTYGLGSCPGVVDGDPSACSSYTVDAASPQAATATLGLTAGSSSVKVATQTTGLPAGHIGQAVQFNTPNARPTRANPSLFVMLYDRTLVPPNGLVGFTMERAPDDSNAFVAIPDCRANGTPPSGNSCVDMRAIAGVSSELLANGDARIVIRTTENSRWVGV